MSHLNAEQTAFIRAFNYVKVSIRLIQSFFKQEYARKVSSRTIHLIKNSTVAEKSPKLPTGKATTEEQDQWIKDYLKRFSKKTWRQIQSAFNRKFKRYVCIDTIRRRCQKSGIKTRFSKHKPQITVKQAAKRRAFAHKYLGWTRDQWERCAFSDEARIFLRPTTKAFIKCKDDEVNKKRNVAPVTKFAGGSIMVWGAMTSTALSPLKITRISFDSAEYIKTLRDC